MKLYALITESIVSGEAMAKHICYFKTADYLCVLISHADSWELKGMKMLPWADFVTSNSTARTIEFQEGHHLLTFNSKTNCWKEA